MKITLGNHVFHLSPQVGRYEFVRIIGKGGFSVVVLVKSISDGADFACKIYSRELLQQADMTQKFRYELQILQTLSHPSLVRLEEVLSDSELIYLVMEYCALGELFSFIEYSALNAFVARRLFVQIVAGISYIHSKGIAHRDLKPQNILLDASEHVKIADFGMGRRVESHTLLSTPCGSLFYAPPEILSHRRYDGRAADIWSLGIVLHVMVTGNLPWKGTSEGAVIHQIMQGTFALPGGLSPLLIDLLVSMLRVDPAERLTIDQVAQHPWVTGSVDVPHVCAVAVRRDSSLCFQHVQTRRLSHTSVVKGSRSHGLPIVLRHTPGTTFHESEAQENDPPDRVLHVPGRRPSNDEGDEPAHA
jgi:serine/threonine protein kinase